MSDVGKSEFWDYTHKESSSQFRIYKQARQILEPYENFFNEKVRGLTAQEVEEKRKSGKKFKFKVGPVTVRLKSESRANETFCKDALIDTYWELIHPVEIRVVFDEKGEISLVSAKSRDRILRYFNVYDMGNIRSINGFKLETGDPENLRYSERYVYRGSLGDSGFTVGRDAIKGPNFIKALNLLMDQISGTSLSIVDKASAA